MIDSDADLIARLRESANMLYKGDWEQMGADALRSAADRIEALTAELAESQNISGLAISRSSAHLHRANSAEARLARAEECIEQVRLYFETGYYKGIYRSIERYDTAKEQGE